MRATVIRCTAPGSQAIATDEFLAQKLAEHDIALKSVSLLSAEEGAHLHHDADLLADRIVEIVTPLRAQGPIGVIGYAATAAGAIIAAAEHPQLFDAVVAVNGRTDLSLDALRNLHVPTMLVVNDMPVLRVNREALSFIKSDKRLEVVHGNGDETVRAMVDKSVRWFSDKLLPVAVVA